MAENMKNIAAFLEMIGYDPKINYENQLKDRAKKAEEDKKRRAAKVAQYEKERLSRS